MDVGPEEWNEHSQIPTHFYQQIPGYMKLLTFQEMIKLVPTLFLLLLRSLLPRVKAKKLV